MKKIWKHNYLDGNFQKLKLLVIARLGIFPINYCEDWPGAAEIFPMAEEFCTYFFLYQFSIYAVCVSWKRVTARDVKETKPTYFYGAFTQKKHGEVR